jgi:hypothetical protein
MHITVSAGIALAALSPLNGGEAEPKAGWTLRLGAAGHWAQQPHHSERNFNHLPTVASLH